MRQESPDEQPKLVAYGEVMGVLSRSGLVVIFDSKIAEFLFIPSHLKKSLM